MHKCMLFDIAKDILFFLVLGLEIKRDLWEMVTRVGFTIQTQTSLRELYRAGGKLTGGMEERYHGGLPLRLCCCWENGDPEPKPLLLSLALQSQRQKKDCFPGSPPPDPDGEAEQL